MQGPAISFKPILGKNLRKQRLLDAVKLTLATVIFGLPAGQVTYALSGNRLWAALFVSAVITHVAYRMWPEYDRQPQAKNLLDTLRDTAEGRVWKRLDEHRELAELISKKAPDLLNEQPWVASWFCSQDEFLTAVVDVYYTRRYDFGDGLTATDDSDWSKLVRKAPAWMDRRRYQYSQSDFTGVQLCPKCHPEYGCGHDHSWLVHDTGTCSICGETNEVVNCRLANLAQNLGIPDKDVCHHLPRLVRDKGIQGVEREYRDHPKRLS